MHNSSKSNKIYNKNYKLTSLAEDICPEDAPFRGRLHALFSKIEKEFELLYIENLNLQEKLDAISGASGGGTTSTAGIREYSNTTTSGGGDRFLSQDLIEPDVMSNKSIKSKLTSVTSGTSANNNNNNSASGITNVINSNHTNQPGSVSGSGGGVGIVGSTSSKIKAGNKLRAQTSRIVSSFKAQSVVSSIVRDYSGHKDGVWQVAAKTLQPIIGTASADHTACIWGIDSGRCLLQYQGHGGSVNSIKFHSTKDLVLTGSGDATAHIWQAAVNWDTPLTRKGHSSEEELDDEDDKIEERERIDVLRTPLCEFSGNSSGGHTSVVVAADWLPGGDQIITASWDRTAILWDVETKEPLQPLTGHDGELTYTSVHPYQRLVCTASRDSTFRLWDFRDQIPAVSVFQGHTESVTSTIFTRDDKVVSGSDDRSVKVWELRNMRSALTTIRTDSAINRLSVSTNGVIAIPHDNRHIRLFDLNGQRIARLPRSNRLGHRRMVSSVAWSEVTATCNLFSVGFDRRVLGWSISLPKEN